MNQTNKVTALIINPKSIRLIKSLKDFESCTHADVLGTYKGIPITANNQIATDEIFALYKVLKETDQKFVYVNWSSKYEKQ